MRVGKKIRRGHDVTWEIKNGRPILPGHQPDHTCRLTSCINPHHLELVTCGENKRRAWLPPYSTGAERYGVTAPKTLDNAIVNYVRIISGGLPEAE